MSKRAKKKRKKRPAETEAAETGAGPAGWIDSATRRRVLAWLVVVTIVAGVAIPIWRHVRPYLRAQPEYLVHPDKVFVSPDPPPWIRANVKAEALRDASLDGHVSIFDEPGSEMPLTRKIAEAFTLHPWVADVNRVSKHHPAHVEVEVVYRKPVCMVDVPGGLYPVDVEGVVLPTDDFLFNEFTKAEARRYPRLSGIETMPASIVGTPWGDSRVHAAAQIAAVLEDHWEPLGLERMIPSAPSAGEAVEGPIFELKTRAGTRIMWGHAPGVEPAGEAKAAEKLRRMLAYVSAHGSLDAGRPGQIDLRPAAATEIHPRTASREDASAGSTER